MSENPSDTGPSGKVDPGVEIKPEWMNQPQNDYGEGNSYVESLGGVDLLAQRLLGDEVETDELALEDYETIENEDQKEAEPVDPQVIAEERRGAAVNVARSLAGIDNVKSLLAAAGQIEAYLRDGTLPGGDPDPLPVPESDADPTPALPEPDDDTGA